MRNGEMDAVHIDDLQTLLQRMGLKEKFNANELKCKFCNTKINIENIHSILPESGRVSVICNDPGCIQKLLAYLGENKKSGL